MGFGEHNFRNYPMYVSFQIFGSKLVTFFGFFNRTHPFNPLATIRISYLPIFKCFTGKKIRKYGDTVVLRNYHQHSYGFKNLMLSGGRGNNIFEITTCTWVFKYLVPNLFAYLVVFWIILSLTNFNQIATVSLRGSGQIYTTRPEGSSLRMDGMGWGGWMDG